MTSPAIPIAATPRVVGGVGVVAGVVVVQAATAAVMADAGLGAAALGGVGAVGAVIGVETAAAGAVVTSALTATVRGGGPPRPRRTWTRR